MSKTLRQALRSGTADSHNRIDRRMGSLDLTTIGGLSQLLGAHYLVQSLFERSLPSDQVLGFLPHLEADFAALGLDLPRWSEARDVAHQDPLGYRYVVTGSQLGARLLYRDWSAATDPTVRAASHYLGANMKSRAWREFLVELDATAATPERVEGIVAAANAVFAAFDLAATEMGVSQA